MREAPRTTLVALAPADPLPEGQDGDPFVLIRRWQDFLEVSGRAGPNTRRQYRRYLLSFLADVLKDPREITEDEVVAYLAGLDGRGEMRGMTIRALRSFYAWAEERGLVANPVRRIKVPPRKYGPAPALSPAELERFLAAAGRLPDPRARPALELMYATGARVSSLCAVMPQDVDLERGRIAFRVAKHGQPYAVPLGPRGLRAARELLELRDWRPRNVRERRPTLLGVGPFVVWRWCKAAGGLAGLEVHPHLLRHTFATRLAEDPRVDVRTWVELMNHRDASLLRRYAAASEERMRKAVEGL
ncbi:MAG TPA: tyrosine-type recombinase/integrase [Actinomycetota bacterium]|nr:tyrosine-type recombinase/integrase [Actinomycetota bacterium]